VFRIAGIRERLTAAGLTLSVGVALGYALTKAWVESAG